MLKLDRMLALLALAAGAVACSDAKEDAFPVADGERPSPGPSAPVDFDDSGLSPPPIVGQGGGTTVSNPQSPGGSPAIGADEAEGPSRDNPSGDRYDAVGTNPFVLVAHDPLSTFAADVDTASYDIFRRYAPTGNPDPASVRLEEFVNYFHYDYPAPPADSEEPFSILLAAAPNPLRAGTTLLRVGIQGKAAPEEETKPANIVFLVDVSGSMQSSDRLPLAQQVLRQTLDLLQPTDKVSIVSYASDTRVRLEPTPVSERATIIAQIDALSAGGSTAGASGIELAYQQAEAGFIEGGINHVVLCTDGDFNVGPSSTEQLLNIIRVKRTTGVTLTALGFGSGNLNDGMLEAVSNAGNGIYGVITSEEQAADYVSERLLSNLNLIAKDVKLQVEFNPLIVNAYRLLGYENRAIADDDFRDDVVDAGEIGAEHQVTALYEIVLEDQDIPEGTNAPASVGGAAYTGAIEVDTDDLVLVKVRYKNLDAGEDDAAFEVSSSLAPSAVASAGDELDPDLAWAISLAGFAEILKESPYALPDTMGTLESTFEAQAERDDDRAEFLELFTSVKGRMTSP
ncbi:MAG: von Willebrand factor type A domain-containing protein [Polyangiaceae bacterium]